MHYSVSDSVSFVQKPFSRISHSSSSQNAKAMRQEIQYVLLLTILSIGWMVGFIWVVVAGTARYVNSMYAIDSNRYVCRQVPLTNESSTVLSATANATTSGIPSSMEKSRFDDYPSIYEFSVSNTEPCPSATHEIDFQSPNWKQMCDCAKQDMYNRTPLVHE